MHRRRHPSFRRDAQGFFLDAAPPALQHGRGIRIHERGQTPLESAVNAVDGHKRYQRIRPRRTSNAMVKSPRKL